MLTGIPPFGRSLKGESTMANDTDTSAAPATDSAPDAPAKEKKKAVSKRIVLGPDRAESDTWTGAYGLRYESLSEPGAVAELIFRPFTSNGTENDKGLPEEMIYALAAFGGLTLAGNVTNVIRNGTPKADGPQTEREALEQWVADLMDGNWTKTSGEVEPGMGELAEAVARTLSDNDKKDRTSAESIAKVKDWLAGLDKDARAKWRGDLRVKRHQAAIRKEKADARAANAPVAPLPDVPTDLDI